MSVARVYVEKGDGKITVNNKDYTSYFPLEILQEKVLQPLNTINMKSDFDIKIRVKGGGINGQAEAIQLGISRSLCEINPENRSVLKSKGLLTRDSRVVERKKPGQKKARKKFQWVKR